MTDIANATPAAVDIAVGETTVPDVQQKAPKPKVEKPEKPDEAKYKEDLAKAEKEHTIAQEKFVSLSISAFCIYNCAWSCIAGTLNMYLCLHA